MATLFVLDVTEFAPVLEAARAIPGASITGPTNGYWMIRADRELALNRQRSGLRLALWYSALMGGFIGHIAQYDRDDIRITDAQ